MKNIFTFLSFISASVLAGIATEEGSTLIFVIAVCLMALAFGSVFIQAKNDCLTSKK